MNTAQAKVQTVMTVRLPIELSMVVAPSTETIFTSMMIAVCVFPAILLSAKSEDE